MFMKFENDWAIVSSSLIKLSESEVSILPVRKQLRCAQFFLKCASSRISSCIFSDVQYFFGWEAQNPDSDPHHQRAECDAAHKYRSRSFDDGGAAEACTARWLRLPPLCSGLLCGCERWRCLKRGIRLVFVRLSAIPSFPSCSRLKTRNSTLRHVVQNQAVIINYI